MKSNKGITLVVLVIIVAVLIIITSVAISTGTSALNSTRLKGFYTQLEIVQKRVDEIASNDEFYIDESENKIQLTETGLKYGETGFNIETLTTIIALEGGNSIDDYIQNFRYFTKEQVKTILGVNDIDYNLFINFEERIIIAEEGIKLKDKIYYMLQSATYFVKNYSKTESDVDFTVGAKKLTDGKYKIVIIPNNTGNSIIKYKEVSTKYWEKTNELEINVTGTLPKYFDIQYKDLDINKSITKSYGIYLDENKNVQITLIKKIYTAQNLLDIEENAKIPEEYTKTYILMNNISFTPSIEYLNLYLDDYNIYYWKPIGEIKLENNAIFEGNNNEIYVNYTDSDGDDYTVTYNKENNYSEIEYEFNIKTYLVNKYTKEELADFIDIYDITTEKEKYIGNTVKVKRGVQNAIKVQAIPSNILYNKSTCIEIKVEKPSKINTDVTLEITYKEEYIISNSISYIGYYADIDGNGTVDGIIYADLAFEVESEKWNTFVDYGENEKYSYSKKETLNNYYIIQESYQYKSFEAKPVIAPIDKVEENDRFYVMALEDFTTKDYTEFYWYYNADESQMDDYENATSKEFGTGKKNTETMMTKIYGDGLVERDVWSNINSLVEKGWFVPSGKEWISFGTFTFKQGVNYTNLDDYGLQIHYWTSVADTSITAKAADFCYYILSSREVDSKYPIRLSVTF